MSQHQQSVASLSSESQQNTAMRATRRASQEYPSVNIEGVGVHVCQNDGEWEVWLNCEDADFTGLCVGWANTRDEAVAQSVKSLEAVLEFLQGPPQS